MKNIFNFLAIVAFGSLVNAQVSLNNGAQNAAINNSNVAIDLSSAFSTEAGAGANVGKGIVVPSVDLVNFNLILLLLMEVLSLLGLMVWLFITMQQVLL